MPFGKDSSFVFIMQDGKLVNVGRSDNTADKQPFDDIEEEVWRIFGEHKELQAQLKAKDEEIEKLTAITKLCCNNQLSKKKLEQALKETL